MRSRLVVALLGFALVGLGAPRAPAASAPSDPLFAQQWPLAQIDAPLAWARGTGAGVKIAVVDTGVDLHHEDLAGKVVADVSCVGAEDDPSKCHGSGQDDNGHGTHVAGIAAAATGNGKGIAGVAPDARIMAVKVFQNDPPPPATTTTDPSNPEPPSASATVGDVRAGIEWAVDHGAAVVNLSLGDNQLVVRNLLGSPLDSAIRYAWDHGAIPVIAAGNQKGLFGSGYGSLPVIVVTATTNQDQQAGYATNVGNANWGMAAPGGDGTAADTDYRQRMVLSTWWQDGSSSTYAYLTGTSMAVPHVVGAAAILRGLGLTPQQTVDRLLKSAKDLGSPGQDSVYGYGRLDLAAATAGFSDHGSAKPSSSGSTVPQPTPTTAPTSPTAGAAAVSAGSRITSTSRPPTSTSSPTITGVPTSSSSPPPSRSSSTSRSQAFAPGPGGGGGAGSGMTPWAIGAGLALAAAALALRGVWLRRALR